MPIIGVVFQQQANTMKVWNTDMPFHTTNDTDCGMEFHTDTHMAIAEQ